MTLFIHIALYLFYLALFLWLIARSRFFEKSGLSKIQLKLFFLLKVAAGVVFTLIYTYYYTDQSKADIYRYFNDSKVISSLLFQQPNVWLHVITGVGINEPEVFRHILSTLYFSHPEGDMATNNAGIIRIISIFNYFSFYNIYINTLFFNFISFIGLTALFRVLRKYFEAFPAILMIPIFLLPSVVFWGSGMIKEQIIFALLGAYFSLALRDKKQSYLTWLLFPIILYLIYSVKPFIAISLLVSSLFLPVIGSRVRRNIMLVLVLAVACLLAWKPGLANGICEQLINKHNEFAALAIIENADSYFGGNMYPADCKQLLLHVPQALVHAVLRPFVWEKGTFFQFLSGLENSLFLMLILFLLIKYFKKPGREQLLIAMSLILFAFLNYLVIGITVPITGAMVHYRVIATPFLLIAALLFTDPAGLNASYTVLRKRVSSRF